jgi:hypothetical protein
MDIDIEQCRENDKIKEIISNSGLPIKHIKLLLRLSDAIYINAINYNVVVDANHVIILFISSKPKNKTGVFNTISLTNVLFRLKEMERDNDDLNTVCEVEDKMLKVTIDLEV